MIKSRLSAVTCTITLSCTLFSGMAVSAAVYSREETITPHRQPPTRRAKVAIRFPAAPGARALILEAETK